jgi:hypothetical protein
MTEAPPIMILDLDTERLKSIRKSREVWLESETAIQDISEKSGGIFFAPETVGNSFDLWFKNSGSNRFSISSYLFAETSVCRFIKRENPQNKSFVKLCRG